MENKQKKSYNMMALRGEQYDDNEWQTDFMDATGILIPEEYLFTSKAPKYAIDQVFQQNIEDYMSDGMDRELALKNAKKNRDAARGNLNKLLNEE